MSNFEYQILEELKLIRERLEKLEQWPFGQPFMPTVPIQPIRNPPSNCSKCGLKLEGAMGYVCNNNPCPTGLGGVWCSNTPPPTQLY